MVPAHDLLRIFWPSDVPGGGKEQGTIIGWRNSALDVLVVTVVKDGDPAKVRSALECGTLFRGCQHPMKQLYDLCGVPSLQVLGVINPATKQTTAFDPSYLVLSSENGSKSPTICCSAKTSVSAQIILFRRPSPHKMQYMSLKPIALALGDQGLPNEFNPRYLTNTGVGAEEGSEQAHRARLVEKLKLHTVIRHPTTEKEKMLPRVLAQINCSAELGALIKKNAFALRARAKRSLSVGEKVVESATTLKDYLLHLTWHIITLWIWPVMTQLLILALLCHRVAAELVLRVLAWRFSPDGAALKDISATAQQVDIRLQQFCYWPIQYLTLRRRKEDWESITDRHPDYIRFYNSLWLVANDVIIGIAVGSYIIDNAELVAWSINGVLNGWAIEGLMDMISWLMDWPAGLKLNNELASFLGGLVLFMIEYWRSCVTSFQPLMPSIIYAIGLASFAGATMPVAMSSDLLSLLTVHIYCFYTAFARIFHWQLTIIISLFHLFRGKKHNVLRNRIDSCDYDLDQLLLGTILFTLLFFLLPTIAVFYMTFTGARMAIIFLKAGQDTILVCLNHFPLFALMLRVKDPRRLPGGISFELVETSPIKPTAKKSSSSRRTAQTRSSPSSSPPSTSPAAIVPTSYIHLNPVPLSLRAMFDQYFQLGHRIRRHYLAPHVLFRLVTGRFLPPIHRKSMYSLQYSMLPARRASIVEVWTAMSESAPSLGTVSSTAAAGSGQHGRKSSAGYVRLDNKLSPLTYVPFAAIAAAAAARNKKKQTHQQQQQQHARNASRHVAATTTTTESHAAPSRKVSVAGMEQVNGHKHAPSTSDVNGNTATEQQQQ